MNLHVICNPTSGNGAGRDALQKVKQLLKEKDVAAVYHETAHPLHAIELTRQAVQEGADTVIAIGGDGTLHEVAQELKDTKTVLGIIPAGTGNDFIKSINIPLETEKALEIILSGSVKAVDTVQINDRLFLNECGCGFDVMVLDYAEKAKKHVKGLLPYLYGVLQTIGHFKSVHVKLSVEDNPPEEKDILVLAVANGRFIGGGIPIAPHAIPDDGLLDVLVVDTMTKGRMISVLPGLLKGKIEDFKETVHQRVKSLRLESKNVRINIDGEIITLDHADISIKPASLLVFRP